MLGVCWFLCFLVVGFCLFCLFVLKCICCFRCLFVSFGLILLCSLCLLEWSRCCSYFVLFGLFRLCLFFVSLCLFLSVSRENHCFPCNSSDLGLMWNQSLFLISVSGSYFSFLFCLLFVSRCSFVFCFACCFVLFRITRLDFILLCILRSCSFSYLFCFFVIV